MQQSHSYHPRDKMSRSLCSIFVLILMAQSFRAMPLTGAGVGDSPVAQTASVYHQKIRKMLLLSEGTVNEHYEKLPQLQGDFDSYLIMLNDYKSSPTRDARKTREQLASWSKLLEMINAEEAKSNEEATTPAPYIDRDDEIGSGDTDIRTLPPIEEETTIIDVNTEDNYDEATTSANNINGDYELGSGDVDTSTPFIEEETTITEELPFVEEATIASIEEPVQRIKNLKLIFLKEKLQELMENSLLTDTAKSIELLTRLVEWDETYDRDSFTEALKTANEDIIFVDHNLPKLLTEYERLLGMYTDMVSGEQESEQSNGVKALTQYIEAFKIDSAEIRHEEETTTTTTNNASVEEETTIIDVNTEDNYDEATTPADYIDRGDEIGSGDMDIYTLPPIEEETTIIDVNTEDNYDEATTPADYIDRGDEIGSGDMDIHTLPPIEEETTIIDVNTEDNYYEATTPADYIDRGDEIGSGDMDIHTLPPIEEETTIIDVNTEDNYDEATTPADYIDRGDEIGSGDMDIYTLPPIEEETTIIDVNTEDNYYEATTPADYIDRGDEIGSGDMDIHTLPPIEEETTIIDVNTEDNYDEATTPADYIDRGDEIGSGDMDIYTLPPIEEETTIIDVNTEDNYDEATTSANNINGDYNLGSGDVDTSTPFIAEYTTTTEELPLDRKVVETTIASIVEQDTKQGNLFTTEETQRIKNLEFIFLNEQVQELMDNSYSFHKFPKLLTEYARLLGMYTGRVRGEQGSEQSYGVKALTQYIQAFKMDSPKILQKEETTIASIVKPDTEQKNVFTHDETQSIKNLKLIFLNEMLQELMDNSLLTDTEKSIALLTRLVEWDETYDRESFTEAVNSAFKDLVFPVHNLPQLLTEFLRLRDMHEDMVSGELSYEQYKRAKALTKYMEAFKIDSVENVKEEHPTGTTKDLSDTEEPTNKQRLFTIDEQLREEKKELIMNQKMIYLVRQLKELNYHIYLRDSEKAYILLAEMVEWDEMNDRESFNNDLQSVSRAVIGQDETKIKLLTEFRRLRNLQMEMNKWYSSYELQSLKKYLNSFTFDTEEIAPTNFNHLSVLQMEDDFSPSLLEQILKENFQFIPRNGMDDIVSTQILQQNPFGGWNVFDI